MSALLQAAVAVRESAPPDRSALLALVLDPSRLPTPPAVALQVVHAASRPDCRPAELIGLLSQDPALCAKLLKAVNSCIYGLPRPVASLDRAVFVLGLSTLRSLALGLSLPAMQGGRGAPAGAMKDYWVASVSGAIMARELAGRLRRPGPEDELVAALLRDLGALLLSQTFPEKWRRLTADQPERMLSDPCRAEEEAFGIGHADVTAELLVRWNFPPEVVEPIRHHHDPDRLAGGTKVQADRAELLYFVSLLTQLDTVAHYPDVLKRLLTLSEKKFGLGRTGLVDFLKGVVPKIEAFSAMVCQDVGKCPDYAAVLVAGAEELVKLTVEANRTSLSGVVPMPIGRPQSGVFAQPAPRGLSGAVPVPGERESLSGGLPVPPARTPPPTPRPAAQETHVYHPVEWGVPPDLRVESPPAPPPAPPLVTTPGPRSGHRLDNGLPDFNQGCVDYFPEGGCNLDGFELRSVLGRGAMGVVFKAFEPSLERDVAVKVLLPDLAAQAVPHQRFMREAKTAAAVRHENVVAIYAVREAAGLPYLAMEFVDGQSLEDRLTARGPLPVPELVRVARQIAGGLAAAHARKIIHRDIKPANILVERDTGTVKITDFGLARGVNDAKLSLAGTIVGTPRFMAPEQVHDQPLDHRADLFSLGSVLYSLATGVPAFPGEHVIPVLLGVCEKEPVRPRDHRADLPDWFEAVVLRLMRKKPADRFASATELLAALTAHPV